MNTRRVFAAYSLTLFCVGCAAPLPRGYDIGASAGLPTLVAPGRENGLPLVVIRFPARVASRAAEQYEVLYDNRGFFNIFYSAAADDVIVPWIGLNTSQRPRDMQGAAIEAISKSTYLAVQFYNYLRTKFPVGSVHLMPTEIDVKGEPARKDNAAQLHDGWPTPLVERTAYDYPPAVIYVDIFAYVNPFHRTKFTTFGASLTPLFSVSTASSISPKTGGALVMPDAFVPYARDVRHVGPTLNDIGGPLIEYLNGVRGVPADHFVIAREVITTKLPIVPGKALILPVSEFALDVATISRLDGLPERPLFDAFYAILASAENTIDRGSAIHVDEAKYIALYDSVLASKFLSGATLTARESTSIGLIHQFALAEWKLIGMQDDQFAKQLLEGEWGSSYRKTRVAEQKFEVKLSDAYQSQQNSMMMQVFSGGMPKLGAGRQSPAAMLQTTMNRLQLSLDLNEKDKAGKRELAADTQQFQSRLAGVSAESVRFIFYLAGQSTDVQVRSVAELRAKMRAILIRAIAKP